MTSSYFQLLINHDSWASHRVAETLLQLNDLPPKPEALMSHILAAQETWLSRVSGRDARYEIWDNSIDPQSWNDLIENFRLEWETLLSDEAQLKRVITYKNSKGTSFKNEVWEILTHLTLHGQYHRGQVITHIRSLINTPPSTDMIVFMRESSASL